MSAQPQPLSQFPSLDAWGQDFMRAAVEHPRTRRPLASRINRRIAGPLAIALALPAGAAIAAASGLVDRPDTPRHTPHPPPPARRRGAPGPARRVPAGPAIAAASGLVGLPDRSINPPPFELQDDGGPPF